MHLERVSLLAKVASAVQLKMATQLGNSDLPDWLVLQARPRLRYWFAATWWHLAKCQLCTRVAPRSAYPCQNPVFSRCRDSLSPGVVALEDVLLEGDSGTAAVAEDLGRLSLGGSGTGADGTSPQMLPTVKAEPLQDGDASGEGGMLAEAPVAASRMKCRLMSMPKPAPRALGGVSRLADQSPCRIGNGDRQSRIQRLISSQVRCWQSSQSLKSMPPRRQRDANRLAVRQPAAPPRPEVLPWPQRQRSFRMPRRHQRRRPTRAGVGRSGGQRRSVPLRASRQQRKPRRQTRRSTRRPRRRMCRKQSCHSERAAAGAEWPN